MTSLEDFLMILVVIGSIVVSSVLGSWITMRHNGISYIHIKTVLLVWLGIPVFVLFMMMVLASIAKSF